MASTEQDAPVILFDPWPRAAPLIFAADMLQRFERLGRIVGLVESGDGKLPVAFSSSKARSMG